MTRLALIAPLAILFAWSSSWTCSTYTLPDGGTSPFNPSPGSTGSVNGGEGLSGQDASVVYQPDSGSQFGLMAGPDGGVTVGQAASFSSDFVYMSNSGDGTISRIWLPPSDAGCPGSALGQVCEQARYYSVVPVDNHGVEPLVGGNDIWQSAGQDQLQAEASCYGGAHVAANCGCRNSPSRTVVDRSGNVWVALRTNSYQCAGGANLQAGVTEIVNVGDNLAQCTPRCHQRHLLVGNQPFTEGIPLNLAAGGTVTLTPPTIIAPGSSYATTYYCEDPGADTTGTSERDDRNYDDCLKMSIPLGDPHPDPLADPDGLTRGYSFGRAAAMSPNCNPATEQCDVWVGMWNGAAMVHLGYSSPYAGGAPYDVVAVHPLGGNNNPYGAAVDCAGIVWSGAVGVGQLSAITTVALNDPSAGLSVPADTVISGSGIPRYAGCTQYGIASDIAENIWIAGWSGGAKACSFNAGSLLTAYETGGLTGAALKAAWHTYDLGGFVGGSFGSGRGINTDKNNLVYMAGDGNAAQAVAFDPTHAGSVPCTDGNGAACPNGTFSWFNSNGGGDTSIGLDLDAEGDVWVGNYSSHSAVEFAATTAPTPGQFLNRIDMGDNVYSYSDFSGYALRNITLATGLLTQTFNGCGDSPEFTKWQELTYGDSVPSGTDIEIQVLSTNSLAPSVLATETPITVCQSVASGNCSDPIDLASQGVPAGAYLLVDIQLFPKICSQNGGGQATAKPVLYSLDVTKVCGGN